MSRGTERAALAVGLVVAGLPYVLACWRAWRQGWIPTGDNARIVADALAVKSTAPPLLGLASDTLAKATGVAPVRHPGPFEAWVLGAVHLVLPGAGGILVGVLLIGLTAVSLSLLAARALWGAGGVLVTALCVSVVASSLGTAVLATPWNPLIPITPSAALVLCTWAWLLAGWKPGLPAAVLLLSFCFQTHLTELAVALVAIVPPAMFVLLRRRLRFDLPSPPHGRRLVIGTIVAGVVVWLPPLYFELTGRYSNVANLWRAVPDRGGDPPLGIGFGINTMSRVVASPPAWGPRPVLRSVWAQGVGTRGGALAGLLLVVGALLAVVVLAVRRRDAVIVGTSVSSLGSIIGGVYLLSISSFYLGGAVYQSRWAWGISITLWSGLFASVGRLLAPAWFGADAAVRGPARAWTRTRTVGVVLASLVVLGATLRVVAPGARTDLVDPVGLTEGSVIRELAESMEANVPRSTKLALRIPHTPAALTAMELFAFLQLNGYDIKAYAPGRDVAEMLGRRNVYHPGSDRLLLEVTGRSQADPARTVGVVEPLDATRQREHDRLRARLTRQLEAGHVRWTGEARLNGARKPPTPGNLLQGSTLLATLLAGLLRGHLPSIDDARRFALLDVRATDIGGLALVKVARPA